METSSLNKYGFESSFILLVLFLGFSCNYLAGYKRIYIINQESIKLMCEKYKCNTCITEDTNYLTRLKKFFDDTLEIKDMYQPLQAHYYINGFLQSSFINCSAPTNGICNLDWNKNKDFEVFPPRSQVKFKDAISISEYNILLNIKTEKTDSAIYLIWTNSFKKNSEELIKVVEINRNKFCKTCKLYLVNFDSIYISRK
ncbi:MAG: hypothetical protein ABI851_02750 [Saprospiraceae bacterium]